MASSKLFDEFSQRFSDLLKHSPLQDVERNSRALLAQWFAKLDLVTREEFDVQTQVLARTREKLSELEARVKALEARGDAANPDGSS